MASSQASEDIAAIARDLDSWLANAEFHTPPDKKTARCVLSKDDQRNNLDALFKALGVSAQIDNGTILFGIYRYLSPGTSRWNPGSGDWATVVPLKFFAEIPTALGRELAIGEVIRIEGTVEYTGAPIYLALTPAVRSESGSKSSNPKKQKPSSSKSGSKSK